MQPDHQKSSPNCVDQAQVLQDRPQAFSLLGSLWKSDSQVPPAPVSRLADAPTIGGRGRTCYCCCSCRRPRRARMNDSSEAPSCHSAARASEPFLIGTAISVYQNSGCPGTNWDTFEQKERGKGKTTIQGGVKVGTGSDFWNLYEEDIQRAADLGSNAFRLSVEWGRIEPVKGQINAESVARYHAILDCLHGHGMTPMITLHHFVHPQWFEDLGAFTNMDNVKHFVSFCQVAFREFSSKCKLWVTFNEPNVMGFCGFVHGSFPPAKTWNFTAAGKHMCNLFRAHDAVYRAIKRMPGGEDAQIGIVHNHMVYEPLNPNWANRSYLVYICSILNYVWGTKVLLEYFKTGTYAWQAPLGSATKHQEGHKPGLDFIGLNYYGRVRIDWKCVPTCKEGEVMTDMPFASYAPDLYEGLKFLSELCVPMYITETGCADKEGERRVSTSKAYFDEVERAVKDGMDVRGLLYWTLVDNFEWAHGYDIRFGLFEWYDDGTQRRIMRKGTERVAELFKEMPSRIARARGHPQQAPLLADGASAGAADEPEEQLAAEAVDEALRKDKGNDALREDKGDKAS